MLHFRIVNSTLKLADLPIIDAGSPLHGLKTLDIDARDGKLFNKNNPSQSDSLVGLVGGWADSQAVEKPGLSDKP
jgi:hypothetical protein